MNDAKIDKALNASTAALKRLDQDHVAPRPQPYTVAYHYAAGDVPGLSVAVDLLAAKGQLTEKDYAAFYKKYFTADNELSAFRSNSAVIDSELQKISHMLAGSAKSSAAFDRNLGAFSGQLEQANSLEIMRAAVEKIAAETHALAKENRKLQDDLAESSASLEDVRNQFERIHKESQLDPLTGVGNRKYLEGEIVRLLRESQEQALPLSVLMVDIDYFKKFNDTYGHLIGDQVLRLVAQTLVENLKGRDVIARYGGEEFIILLPQTRAEDAERVANQLCINLAGKQIKKRGTAESMGNISISIGIAQFAHAEDSERLIARADAALYKAKQNGRNRAYRA